MIVNAHGGNQVLSNVVQTANAHTPGSMTLFPTRADSDTARRGAGLESSAHVDMHAGELEVSLLAATVPDVIRDGPRDQDHTADDRNLLLVHGMSAYTGSGVIGRPSAAATAKGAAVLDSLTRSFRDHLRAVDQQL